jgi:hypothetical protein
VLPAVIFGYQNKVETYTENNYRYFKTNGIPDHETGKFPNSRNPNSITEQNKIYRVTLKPKQNNKGRAIGLNSFGIAMNGVLFDPGAAEFWNRDRTSGWQYEALSGKIDLGMDDNNAHVQPDGTYHYHGLPIGLYESRKNKNSMTLLGYAADGFPIYGLYGFGENNKIKKLSSSYRIKKGNRPSGPKGKYDGTFVEDYEYIENAGDLDECNGTFGITPEYPEGTYYYVITDTFPFIPRYIKGNPDESFKKGPPSGLRGLGGRPPHDRGEDHRHPPEGPPPHHHPFHF